MSVEADAAKALELLSSQLQVLCNGDESTTERREPLVIGLTGLQGSGKSTWASAIVKLLSEKYGLVAIQVSLDDFYKTHEDLLKLRKDNPTNLLLKTRGQPGSHDESLAQLFFRCLQQRTAGTRIPVFDKSKYNGEGDRLSTEGWPPVPQGVDVVVFEGWCVGFQPLNQDEIFKRWQESSKTPSTDRQAPQSVVTLADHPVEHLWQVNRSLDRYCQTFMGPDRFDCFVHLDTDDLVNVYRWRQQQEDALIRTRGTGMSEQQVAAFVRGYMPAYELYLDQLRAGFFSRQDLKTGVKKHVRVRLGSCREVLAFETL